MKASILLFASIVFLPCYGFEIDKINSIETQIQTAMKYNRANVDDLKIEPSWDIPLTLNTVENLLRQPITAPKVIATKITSLKNRKLCSQIVYECSEWLDTDLLSISTSIPSKEEVTFTVALPEELSRSISELLSVSNYSERLIRNVVESIPVEQREVIKKVIFDKLRANGSEAYHTLISHIEENIPYSVWEAQLFKSMEAFNMSDLLKGAYLLGLACDNFILQLLNLQDKIDINKRIRSIDGKVLISGKGADEYTEKDIENAILIIDLGGSNTYYCSVGYAAEGQVRVVIDLGDNVVIKSTGPAAGVGILGLGFMFLPNPEGKKIIQLEDFSGGCGILGVGGLFLSGEVSIESGNFSQGAGAFGLGILLHNESNESLYRAKFLSQGAGMTKGLGLFYTHGDDVTLEGGLVIKDPRETLGFTSLCQGVGYGPRALAGGGIGLAIIDGNTAELRSSYFAQGSGYWHSLGIFYLCGNDSHIQARRYSQGTGIHTAVGIMLLEGNNNSTINWGVGPAYGWDSGIGQFYAFGNDNTFQAEWGYGHGEVTGRGIFFVSGDRLKLLLPDIGTGTFSRNSASYGIAILNGKDIFIKSDPDRNLSCYKTVTKAEEGLYVSKLDPWGILLGKGNINFSTELTLTAPTWPEPAGDKPKSPPGEKCTPINLLRTFEYWLQEGNIKDLLSIKEENIGTLLQLYQPYKVDELIILRLVFASYGRSIFPYIKERLAISTGIDKVILVNLLSYCPVHMWPTIPTLLSLLQDTDWRIRVAAIRSIGFLFDQDVGIEPGRATIIKYSLNLMKQKKAITAKHKYAKKWLSIVGGGELGLHDIFSFLSMAKVFTSDDKIGLYNINTNFYDFASNDQKVYFGNYLINNRETYIKLYKEELSSLEQLKPEVESALLKMLSDSEEAVQIQAITVLGKLQTISAIEKISSFLTDNRPKVREAAISSLSKFGKRAYPVLKKAFVSGDDITKALIVTSAVHGWDKTLLKLLHHGIKDKSSFVQLSTVGAVLSLKQPLNKEKGKLIRKIKKRKW